MSIAVALEELRDAVAQRGTSAYVLTVTDDGRPHVVHAPVQWRDRQLIAEVGKSTARNANARPQISLLYPMQREGEYSLIIDGVATVETGADNTLLVISPSKGILHRPAVTPDPTSSCGADCVPLLRQS